MIHYGVPLRLYFKKRCVSALGIAEPVGEAEGEPCEEKAQMCVEENGQRRPTSSVTTNPVTGDIHPFMVILLYCLGWPSASVTNDPANSASWIAGKAGVHHCTQLGLHFVSFGKILFICLFICLLLSRGRRNVYVIVYMQRLEDTFWKLVLSFHHASSRDWAWIFKLGQPFSSLRCLTRYESSCCSRKKKKKQDSL